MKRIISGLLILAITISCLALVACSQKEDDNTEIGLVYSVLKDENGDKYAVVKKYGISEDDAKTIADGDYKSILVDLVIPTEYKETETSTPVPVTEIAEGAFSNQLILKSITVGANIKKIGAGAFSGCANLEELTIPFAGGSADAVNNAKNFNYVFGTTSFLNGVAASAKHNEAGEPTTYYVPSNLKKVTVTGDVLSDYAFYGSTVEEIVLSGNITEIGEASFSSMGNLRTFNMPQSVTAIGKFAFKDSTSLYKIDFSKSTNLSTIFQEAFMGCSLLGYGNNALILPNSVETIHDRAFKNCTSLKEIDLSNTKITSVSVACFYGSTALKTVTVKAGTVIQNDALPTDNDGFNLIEK